MIVQRGWGERVPESPNNFGNFEVGTTPERRAREASPGKRGAIVTVDPEAMEGTGIEQRLEALRM